LYKLGSTRINSYNFMFVKRNYFPNIIDIALIIIIVNLDVDICVFVK